MIAPRPSSGTSLPPTSPTHPRVASPAPGLTAPPAASGCRRPRRKRRCPPAAGSTLSCRRSAAAAGSGGRREGCANPARTAINTVGGGGGTGAAAGAGAGAPGRAIATAAAFPPPPPVLPPAARSGRKRDPASERSGTGRSASAPPLQHVRPAPAGVAPRPSSRPCERRAPPSRVGAPRTPLA